MAIRALPYLKALFIRIELKDKYHLNNSKEGNYALIVEHVISFKVVSINERVGLVILKREVLWDYVLWEVKKQNTKETK